MIDILKLILSDFWIFIGSCVLLTTISHFLLIGWDTFWRHLNIRKHGWPPPHCDADGDFKQDEKN